MNRRIFFVAAAIVLAIAGCKAASPDYYIIIRGGTIYNGLGGEPFVADVAITNDRIASIGDLDDASATQEIDAAGKVVAVVKV